MVWKNRRLWKKYMYTCIIRHLALINVWVAQNKFFRLIQVHVSIQYDDLILNKRVTIYLSVYYDTNRSAHCPLISWFHVISFSIVFELQIYKVYLFINTGHTEGIRRALWGLYIFQCIDNQTNSRGSLHITPNHPNPSDMSDTHTVANLQYNLFGHTLCIDKTDKRYPFINNMNIGCQSWQ